jgi:hypothetical protein
MCHYTKMGTGRQIPLPSHFKSPTGILYELDVNPNEILQTFINLLQI